MCSPAEFIAVRSIVAVYNAALIFEEVTMVTGDALVRFIDTHATSVVTRQTQALSVSVVAAGTLGDTAAKFLHEVELFVT